jgi:hypothetical protein
VERRWQVVIEPYPGKGLGREISRVEHRDMGCVGGRIVHEREHPTVVLGLRRTAARPRHGTSSRDSSLASLRCAVLDQGTTTSFPIWILPFRL